EEAVGGQVDVARLGGGGQEGGLGGLVLAQHGGGRRVGEGILELRPQVVHLAARARQVLEEWQRRELVRAKRRGWRGGGGGAGDGAGRRSGGGPAGRGSVARSGSSWGTATTAKA